MLKKLKKLFKPKNKDKTLVWHPTFGEGKIYKRTKQVSMGETINWAYIKFETANIKINESYFKGSRIEYKK